MMKATCIAALWVIVLAMVAAGQALTEPDPAAMPWDNVLVNGLTIGTLASVVISVLKRVDLLRTAAQCKVANVVFGALAFLYALIFEQGIPPAAALAQASLAVLHASGVYEMVLKPLGIRYMLEKAGKD